MDEKGSEFRRLAEGAEGGERTVWEEEPEEEQAEEEPEPQVIVMQISPERLAAMRAKARIIGMFAFLFVLAVFLTFAPPPGVQQQGSGPSTQPKQQASSMTPQRVKMYAWLYVAADLADDMEPQRAGYQNDVDDEDFKVFRRAIGMSEDSTDQITLDQIKEFVLKRLGKDSKLGGHEAWKSVALILADQTDPDRDGYDDGESDKGDTAIICRVVGIKDEGRPLDKMTTLTFQEFVRLKMVEWTKRLEKSKDTQP